MAHFHCHFFPFPYFFSPASNQLEFLFPPQIPSLLHESPFPHPLSPPELPLPPPWGCLSNSVCSLGVTWRTTHLAFCPRCPHISVGRAPLSALFPLPGIENCSFCSAESVHSSQRPAICSRCCPAKQCFAVPASGKIPLGPQILNSPPMSLAAS